MKPLLARLLATTFALACVAAAGPAVAQNTNEPTYNKSQQSDWELEQERHNWKEIDTQLPPYPKDDTLIEFRVSNDTRFRFYVDAASLSSGPDGVVRYTLVARSPSGYANVSYEGIRCSAKEMKVFATGGDGRWTARESAWRPIEPRSFQRWHNELFTWYLCPNRVPIESAREGADALRRGGHPAALRGSDNR